MEVQWIHLLEIDSTNSWAKRHAKEFDPKKMTCILADVQTEGVTRSAGRKWIGKRGNLHMSLFLATSPSPNLAQLLALAAAQAIGEKSIQIKWPNDLIAQGKKLCGTMAEITSDGAILGIGLNVNTPVETDQPTTFLKELTQKEWDVTQLAHGIAFQFLQNWEKGFHALKDEFEKLLAYKNEKIVCFVGNKKLTGTLLGITEEGTLHMQMENGESRFLSSGEIRRLSV